MPFTLLPNMKKKLQKNLASDFSLHVDEISKDCDEFGRWRFEYVLYYVCDSLNRHTFEVEGELEQGIGTMVFTGHTCGLSKKASRRQVLTAFRQGLLDAASLDSLTDGLVARLANLGMYTPSFNASLWLHRPGSTEARLQQAINHLPSRKS